MRAATAMPGWVAWSGLNGQQLGLEGVQVDLLAIVIVPGPHRVADRHALGVGATRATDWIKLIIQIALARLVWHWWLAGTHLEEGACRTQAPADRG